MPRKKEENLRSTRLLQPLTIPYKKREDISMDFIIRLPKVQGKYCIFVVIDKLTKFAHFFATTIVYTIAYTTTQLADLLFKKIFRLHGL